MTRPLYLAADHAGFVLKEQLRSHLQKRGILVHDLSPQLVAGDDYPKIAAQLARAVANTKQARGILVCGSGVGMAIAANRIKGIRAFDAFDAQTVKLARAHNDANVLALSGWALSTLRAARLVDLFLQTRFSTAKRHQRRVTQLG